MHLASNWGGSHYMLWHAGMGGSYMAVPAIMAVLAPVIILLVLWSLFWKGLSLWHAARRGQYWWFLIMLVINSLGILGIIYLFFVAKLKWGELFSLRSDAHHGHEH
jgi:hypothetical protein